MSNAADLTLVVVGEYPCTVERLWEAYVDPRQVERFWGPPEWPATFTRHDVQVGGESRYQMKGPDGSAANCWIKFLRVEPHRLIEVEEGFAADDGAPIPDAPPLKMRLTFESTGAGSRFTVHTRFANTEAMEEMLKIGAREAMEASLSTLDAVIADLRSFSRELPVNAQLLSDTEVRISRVIKGSAQQVWRAHHEAALMQRWLLGPDGWTMPVCEIATKVGERYRYEWESNDKSQRFGFEGELLESAAPYRAVTTEMMIGMPGPGTRNEMTLTEVQGGTLLSLLITYPSKELRDMILGSGMTDGMETSYARMEREVLAA